ncbi:MAG: hypothetical protein O3A47_12090 [Chloroflexi bacterium]|nr:hypothetical protein [Chloroflexota bacterium]
MQIVVSIPHPVVASADVLARQIGLSRSELITKALRAFIEEHEHDRIREKLDEVYAAEDSTLDPVLARMQFLSLPLEEW